MTAQGNALGLGNPNVVALKEPNKMVTVRGFAIVSPFQGCRDDLASAPRALPWADLFRPLRGEKIQRVRR